MFRHAIILALCCLTQIQAHHESSAPRIIIIGCGPSGIAAGARLLENGFENLTILEAEDRIGGRVYTTQFGGYPVDIGGQWVHGEKDNAVFEMAWPLGLLERSSPTERRTNIFDSTGMKMDDKTGNDLANFFFNNISSMKPTEEYKSRSLGDWYTHLVDEYFKGHPEIKTEQREPLKKSLQLLELALDAADSWFDVSSDSDGFEECEGDQMINWKDKSYGFVLDLLTKKYPNPEQELPVRDKTVLNAEVTKINYNNPDGAVRVLTKNGDEYVADHVIVTPSLGVLKADHEKLFNPPLPETKVSAIKATGFGSVAKIYLKYDNPWWQGSDLGHIFYWTDDDEKAVINDPLKSWLLGFYSVITVENKPNILCCWLTGPRAREMESIPTDQVFSGIKETLHRFLDKSYNLTEPTEMLRSQWHSNPHFRGTYSYRTPETEREGIHADQIAEPIMEQEKPRVMFAGEATSSHQFSTVHGAIGTGWREADRLMKHYGHEATEKPKTA